MGRYSDVGSHTDIQRKISAANTLVAIFDRNLENRGQIKKWILNFSMQRISDLERLWFSDAEAFKKMEKYAVCFNIALISLDDENGIEIGLKLYDLNPDCIICYYKHEKCNLSELLHSRPYEFFLWSQGEEAFCKKLDEMIYRTILSTNTFSVETKKILHCYPVRNILYFQSNLKYVHIITVLGNDLEIYARLSEIEQELLDSGLHLLFIRTHKSFIVNRFYINMVNKQSRTLELFSGDEIPISEAYYKLVVKDLIR